MESAKSPIAPHTSTPAELKERIEAERAGDPFLLYRDADGHQQICSLPSPPSTVTIGRQPRNDIVLAWDKRVSRLHAVIEHVGGSWTITDDNLSSNGSFVNGTRLSGRHRLEDDDAIHVGGTSILFRSPASADEQATERGGSMPTRAELTERQREVLTALCRPCRSDAVLVTPATNATIAGELVMSEHAVKSQLRTLFNKFGIQHLDQNKKRAELVRLALRSGLVSERDFAGRS
ncbi:MAG TPA: FHA domain-containing protein [Thermoleophilaceae bacterium]|nr:FHA domain-containing protein [Thermoleophilaceae bacterium]